MSTFRYLRESGQSVHRAAWLAFAPVRLQALAHLLRGKPLMYGMHVTGPLDITQRDVMVANSRFVP